MADRIRLKPYRLTLTATHGKGDTWGRFRGYLGTEWGIPRDAHARNLLQRHHLTFYRHRPDPLRGGGGCSALPSLALGGRAAPTTCLELLTARYRGHDTMPKRTPRPIPRPDQRGDLPPMGDTIPDLSEDLLHLRILVGKARASLADVGQRIDDMQVAMEAAGDTLEE